MFKSYLSNALLWLAGVAVVTSLSGCLTNFSDTPMFDAKAPSHLVTEGYWEEFCDKSLCEAVLLRRLDSGEWLIDNGATTTDSVRIRDLNRSKFAIEGLIPGRSSKDRKFFYAIGSVNKDGSLSVFNLTIPDGATKKLLMKFPGLLFAKDGFASFAENIKEEEILAVLEFISSDEFWSPALVSSTTYLKQLDEHVGQTRLQQQRAKRKK